MGLLRSMLTGRPDPVLSAALEPIQTFSESPGVYPDSGVMFGTLTFDDYIYGYRKLSRRDALAVPAVKRARDLICGGIGQFPLRLYNPANRVQDWAGLSQPEAGIPASVTWSRVAEDMLFDERSWLRVDTVGWHNHPNQFQRLDAESVSIQPTTLTFPYGTATVWPEVAGLIRCDSPNGGLLTTGATAIRALALLDRAALNHATGMPPVDYFTPAEDVDLPPEQITEILDDWLDARQKRSTGYVPAALKYNVGGFNPEQLQMADARKFAITEVARLTGIEAEALSVAVSSKDYFNAQDRRRQRIEDVLGPYMTAIEQRLSMDDVTPRGYTVRFDTTNYLRLDDEAAAQTDVALVGAQIIDRDEARAKRGLEPRPAPAEVPAPDNEEALTRA